VTIRSNESLYAIIDVDVAEDPIALARRALTFGCAMLQLRAKRLDDRSFVQAAIELREACRQAAVPFVINDRADIAKIVHADGLHLGQEDLCLSDARRIVGSMQIGISTHDLAQALQAEQDGADLIAFGPVFETRSKKDPDPVVGLEMLAEVCRRVARPVIAIGGMTPESAAEAIRQGASYVAVISALPRFLSSP
jgi:thiamine-phosphate diphosphorylase